MKEQQVQPVARVLGSGEFERVGSFRFYFEGQRWEWSDEVARMHGYEPGTVTPTTELLLTHKHPDDRHRVEDVLYRLFDDGVPFSSRHRIIDKQGRTRHVLVIGDRLYDDGVEVGSTGFYVDHTDDRNEQVRSSVDAALAAATESRSDIDQAKGMLMLVYGVSAERAFDVLVWRSQLTNTKLRTLAQQLIAAVTATTPPTDPLSREWFDRLLLTVHQRPDTAS